MNTYKVLYDIKLNNSLLTEEITVQAESPAEAKQLAEETARRRWNRHAFHKQVKRVRA